MNPSSSSKTQTKKKCVPAKTDRRKMDSSRSSLQDHNARSSCSSSNTSIETPRGCLRFLLTHSSSSSKSSPHRPRNFLSRTPICKTHLKSKPGIGKENSMKQAVAPKPQRSKKPSCRNGFNYKTCEPEQLGKKKSLDGTVVEDESGETNRENCTPLSKFPTGSDLLCNVDKNEGFNSESKAKTPPVQPSASPEIQCGSSVLPRAVTPACYGAGHVLSGVTDKRKCRPRGTLVVGDCKLGFEESNAYDNLDDDENNVVGIGDTCSVSPIPLPTDASMHWLLSPCKEEGEDSEDGSHRSQRLTDPADLYSPDSSLSGQVVSAANTSRRRSVSLVSPNGIPCFDDVPNPLSPLSACSLGSGNVMKTPQSDSSSDRRISLPWLNNQDHMKRDFDSEIGSVSEAFDSTRLSPKSQVSMWDPINSSFQFDCMTTPSKSIDLTRIHGFWDKGASWFSSSMSENNMSQPGLRISWREGLVSRIFEMDEFDCCRCLSDEEEDINEKLKSHSSPELSVCANNDRAVTDSIPSAECFNNNAGGDEKDRDRFPAQSSFSCAESITIDRGSLATSEDLDWKLCYKNQLFHVKEDALRTTQDVEIFQEADEIKSSKMEGLIPMVYKAIKKSRTRKQYKCLSSGEAMSYNIADFYDSGRPSDAYITPQAEMVSRFDRHRRNKSYGGQSLEYSPWHDKRTGGGGPMPGKKLVRFRSHRLFSCVTGA